MKDKKMLLQIFLVLVGFGLIVWQTGWVVLVGLCCLEGSRFLGERI